MDSQKQGQCVLMSFYHFRGRGRWWAFKQMGLMHRRMKAWPGMGFYRLLGTGGGSGYSIRPNFSLYAILTVWTGPGKAADFLRSSDIVADYRSNSIEEFHLLLRPLSSRGWWLKTQPFDAREALPGAFLMTVITRARLKWWFMPVFWSRVNGVSGSQGHFEGQLFSQGVGALPWIEQATFSVWSSEEAMMKFAHLDNEIHREAIRVTRKYNGFSEEIYARFQLLDTRGTFSRRDPFEGLDLPLKGFLDGDRQIPGI